MATQVDAARQKGAKRELGCFSTLAWDGSASRTRTFWRGTAKDKRLMASRKGSSP